MKAQHPHPARLAMSGQGGAGQVVAADAARRAAVAVRQSVVPVVAGDRSAVVTRTTDAAGPAGLARQPVSLRTVGQRKEANRFGAGGGRTAARGQTGPQLIMSVVVALERDHPGTRQELCWIIAEL
jgi:hypothetical protein